MKRCSAFIGISLLVLQVFPVIGQYRFGVIGGLNLGNFNGGNVITENTSRKFLRQSDTGIGLAFELSLPRNTALSFQPMYLEQGTNHERRSDAIDDYDSNTDFILSSLEFPFYYKVTLGNRTYRPYLMAGPTIGINLNSYANVKSTWIQGRLELDDQTKRINFSGAICAGVSVALNKSSIFFQVNYLHGVRNILCTDLTRSSGTAKFQTRNIQLLAGMMISFGK